MTTVAFMSINKKMTVGINCGLFANDSFVNVLHVGRFAKVVSRFAGSRSFRYRKPFVFIDQNVSI